MPEARPARDHCYFSISFYYCPFNIAIMFVLQCEVTINTADRRLLGLPTPGRTLLLSDVSEGRADDSYALVRSLLSLRKVRGEVGESINQSLMWFPAGGCESLN